MKLINILIRTSNRPRQFANCIDSILSQQAFTSVHVCYDNPKALEYINNYKFSTIIEVNKNEHKFGYNQYCNPLKDQVTEGWGLFLDDDDCLQPGSLELLCEHIQPGNSYIVPFLRDGKQKPWPALFRNRSIEEGCIGLPCMLFWHEHKKYFNFDYTEIADYKAIKMLSRSTALQWLQIPVVNSPVRSWGRME